MRVVCLSSGCDAHYYEVQRGYRWVVSSAMPLLFASNPGRGRHCSEQGSYAKYKTLVIVRHLHIFHQMSYFVTIFYSFSKQIYMYLTALFSLSSPFSRSPKMKITVKHRDSVSAPYTVVNNSLSMPIHSTLCT